ncbi:MAG: glycoside hydrolase family 18, partial [Rikenellaceae bacterium]|nr:glycoside hydrolase family 18 [Rikenellaceae bacterium]
MEKRILYIMSLLVFATALVACDTEPDNVRVQFPDDQSDFVRDEAYYERLREYKKTDHALAFGWYGSWTAIGPSMQSRLASAPDSMDIISMWSQFHSLTPEQIADKAFIQQKKGTRVVICISAKDIPEEFKENGEITDAALKSYAKAFGKDSLDKYDYDGIDIDFETAIDHQGPLNQTPGLFKKFCEELSQYIGPASGTGRLFLIDGNINSLDAGIAELCDYGVMQAYTDSNFTSLTNRATSAARVGWVKEQLIYTANFESYWSTGGVNFSYNGQTIPSLLGMAYYALEGNSVGFGSYHMEYEYGHSDKVYKYMREAIQIANPAPQGDYTKILVSLDQSGEEIFTVTTTISRYESQLTAYLSKSAPAAVSIPVAVDNSLVEKFNDDNYTEYETIDPLSVNFSGPLRFAKGELKT